MSGAHSVLQNNRPPYTSGRREKTFLPTDHPAPAGASGAFATSAIPGHPLETPPSIWDRAAWRVPGLPDASSSAYARLDRPALLAPPCHHRPLQRWFHAPAEILAAVRRT